MAPINYTREPIAPGKKDTIILSFDAVMAGHFDKHAIIKFTGIDDAKNIGLTGEILPAEEFSKTKEVETKPTSDSTTPHKKKQKILKKMEV